MMRTVKLIIAFDGTRYEGWQSQKNGRTLQEVFERALRKIFGTPTPITGSSRTDSGVHAEGFAAHFRTRSGLSDNAVQRALNFYLPRDIAVLSAKTVPFGFHARFGALSKVYRYTVLTQKTRPIFEAPYVLWYPYPLNAKRMREAAAYLEGRHDFRAFSNKDRDKNTVRRLRRIIITHSGARLTITLEADGFLKQMVRIIVGTLLEAGRGRIRPAALKRILLSKDRKNAGPTASAQGLTLLRVRYR